MNYLYVKDWDKWQSYRKDRGTPPWIKVHRNLLSNPEWILMSDQEKGQLVSIWVLAADKNGRIPESDVLVQRMAMLETTPNLNKFIELGFLTPSGCQHDVNVTPSGCQHDSPEKRRGEENTDVNQVDAKADDAYAFVGERIKLNSKDFSEIKAQYQNIDLLFELKQLDLELRGKPNYWMEMHAKLRYRNDKAKNTPNQQKQFKEFPA